MFPQAAALCLLALAAVDGRKLAASGNSRVAGEDQTKDDYWEMVQGAEFKHSGKTRIYYVRAEEIDWDYVPKGKNLISGEDFTPDETLFYDVREQGSVFKKCVYRGFTDATYSKRLPHPEHMGQLGPVLYAEVGDKVEVHYSNGCSFPNTLHAHGVFYTKGHEGTPHAGTSPKSGTHDDSIAPGGSYTYKWEVPERAGPTRGTRSSALWMYHSHTDEVADVNAGLAGPIVVTAKGMAKEDASPKDIDQELFLLWDVVVEELSALGEKNFPGGLAEVAAKAAAKKPVPADAVDAEEAAEPEDDLGVMHMINGYLYGNMPEPKLKVGSRVRWYNMALGTESHTPHWHGNTGLWGGKRTDVLHVLPADFEILDMVPDATGRWLVHCHLDDHILAGMTAAYEVVA